MANDNKISKFRFALIDDTSHKHLFVIRFNRISLTITLLCSVVLVCLAIFSLIAYTPMRTFIPGYPDALSKKAAIQNAIKVDSLEGVIFRWELYSENLKRTLAGEDAIKLDSLISLHTNSTVKELNENRISRQDSLLRSNVREEEQFEISARNNRNLPIEGVMFFTPLKGAISQDYDPYLHPYIDITAPAGSIVKAALDGTVIASGWDTETGNTIIIQHPGDIITAYKHNDKLLKKIGDKVTAGSPIAVIGNTGELTTGTHLHFELWHKGQTVNPSRYINF